jgi:hypothetical protein
MGWLSIGPLSGPLHLPDQLNGEKPAGVSNELKI